MVVTHNVIGVATRAFSACTNEELLAAYNDAFGFYPCRTCSGMDWQGYYYQIKSFYNKFINIKLPEVMAEKFIWNPQFNGMTVFFKGTPVKVGEYCEQKIMQKIYEDPNRKGMVLAVEDVEVIKKDIEKITKPIAIGEPKKPTRGRKKK